MSENDNLTRRAMLAGAASTVSSVALLGAALAAQPPAASLALLIDAHQSAYQEHDDACGLQGEAHARLKEYPALHVSSVIFPDGSPAEEYEVGPYSAEHVRQFIINRHAEVRRIHCGSWAQRMAGQYVEHLLAFIDASERQANEALDAAMVAIELRKVEACIPEAENLVDQTGAAEIQARLDLLLYRPADAAEAQTKADYINGSGPFLEGWCGEDDFTNALIARLGEVA